MKKDKEWLKEQIERLSYTPKGLDENSSIISKNWALNFIDQLDEPEFTQDEVDKYLHERNLVAVDEMMIHQTGMQNKVVVEKPVIPKFLADYIEKWKYETLIMHEWFTFDHDDQDEDKVSKWLYNNDYETNKRRELMLIDAIRYGYEVEKEKLYTVDLPHSYELIKLLHTQTYRIKNYSESGFGDYTNTFTEAEIKAIDKRYLAFAEEVAE